MEIVVTHNNMDFDALAAQYAVTRLHPGAKMVLGLPLSGNVREFLALYRSSMPIVQSKYIDFDRVTRVFVVDCQHIDRMDDTLSTFLSSVIEKTDKRVAIPITVYDHHEKDPDGLVCVASADSVIEPVGAATTLVVDELIKAKSKLTLFEATLLALGIYEDTGCLTYSGTTELDARCVAYLLKQGIDLEQVISYIRPKLSEEQVELLENLVRDAHVQIFSGAHVVIASYKMEDYVDGLAGLTRKLLEIMSADAAFCVVHMRDRIHVVGRSDTHAIDVRPVVRKFGGDGHPGAGSAVVKNSSLDEVVEGLKQIIAERVVPEPVASDIMTSPVRTIRPSSTMEEANRLMIRYGQDGLIVVDDEDIVGVISRRDIDQAVHHKLGHAPVVGFMSRPVISVNPDTPLSKIQHLMISEDIGRLPVLDRDHLVGLVSRQEVLKTLYGAVATAASAFGETGDSLESFLPHSKHHVIHIPFKDYLDGMEPSTRWLCDQLGRVAACNNMVAYAVGGFVRDLFLDRPNFDLDFVIEGSAIELADALERECPSRFEVVAKHERFQTATLIFHGERDREVDLSTARTEYYEFPAALPTVEPSRLEQDLSRRDFTINGLAVCLNPGRYGELVDHFDGLEDLKRNIIRILHPFSFIEDPTRIVRAARFAARLGFHLEPKTKERARKAVNMGIFEDLGGVRLRDEIKLILESEHRLEALELLEEVGGALRFLDSHLEYGLRTRTHLRRAQEILQRYSVDEPWIVYLGLVLATMPEERLTGVLDRLHLSNDQKETIRNGLTLEREAADTLSSMKRSEIYRVLHNKEPESLAIAACLAAPGTSVRRMIRLYLEELVGVSVKLSGNDLVAMGIGAGPAIGKVLNGLLDGRLNGDISNEDDEKKFVQSWISAPDKNCHTY
jgi:tRNA nucleotidyltransferase/poly(A) polymerase